MRVFWADESGLPASDRKLTYGDGLFETIRVEGAGAPLLAYHLDRLVTDARRLGIPVQKAELARVCEEAVSRWCDEGPRWVLKLVLTRGGGGRGYRPADRIEPNLLVARASAPERPAPEGVIAGFSRVPLTVNPLFAGIKSLNRLEQVMAAREISGDHFELLMANAAGHIVEGTRTNLFVATDNGWLTPPLESVAVAGIMRRLVIESLQKAGQALTETPVLPEHLSPGVCAGLYLTNSVLGVVGVRRLAGQDLPVDQRLATICRSHIAMD